MRSEQAGAAEKADKPGFADSAGFAAERDERKKKHALDPGTTGNKRG